MCALHARDANHIKVHDVVCCSAQRSGRLAGGCVSMGCVEFPTAEEDNTSWVQHLMLERDHVLDNAVLFRFAECT